MANVYDVAKYIINRVGPVSTMKLQKLVYYAQAWNLVWEDQPLFDEDFQAWANGPVCRELFDVHKGNFVIDKGYFDAIGKEKNLTRREILNIESVLDFYGDKQPHWLSNLTHMERPWAETRSVSGCQPGERCEEVIPKELMQEYYAGL